MRCLVQAARDMQVPLEVVDLWQVAPDANARETAITDTMRRVSAISTVFSVIGGDPHHTLGLVAHPRPFDFVLPEVPDLPLDPHAEVVPYDGVRAALAEVARPHLDLTLRVRNAAMGKLIQLEAPPVAADDDRLRRDVPWKFFHGRRTIAPRWLRYKLWRLHSQIIGKFCRDEGIGFVRCPGEAFDEDGFLAAAYYQDAMHVNARYGELVVRQMLAAR
ncbi:MAG TPA: hypothetical protein VN700_00585 [Vicinamibacterales bacterium]|nr:hypothetical protein [Vicinamibacterales bacterium]